MSFFNYDQIHSVPKFEIYVEESLNFTVRCLLWSVPVEHELYCLYKQSVKKITLSNLVSCLSSYKLCPGLAFQFAGGCIEHTVPRIFTLNKTPSPLFQTNYYLSPSCQVLISGVKKCSACNIVEGTLEHKKKEEQLNFSSEIKSSCDIDIT